MKDEKQMYQEIEAILNQCDIYQDWVVYQLLSTYILRECNVWNGFFNIGGKEIE